MGLLTAAMVVVEIVVGVSLAGNGDGEDDDECLGGGSGLIGGSDFSGSLGLSPRSVASPSDRGGSCGGSVGSVGGSDGRGDFFLDSRKEGGAGSALENRDLPVLGVWRVDVSILRSLESVSPAE